MPVTTTRCAPADAPALAALNLQLIQDEGSRNPMRLPELETRMLGFLTGGYQAYFFSDGDALVGYALVRVACKPYYLRQFFICRECRRKGLGTQSFHALLDILGAGEIELEVLYDNHPARAFWERLGFAPHSLTLELKPAVRAAAQSLKTVAPLTIRRAAQEDYSAIKAYDHHVSADELRTAIGLGRIYIAENIDCFAGWLRYNLFWDNTPFMNMLFVLESYRSLGIGKALALRWESDMSGAGFTRLMTSTLANESAQHFYRKLNYRDAGALLLTGEALEIFFVKEL